MAQQGRARRDVQAGPVCAPLVFLCFSRALRPALRPALCGCTMGAGIISVRQQAAGRSCCGGGAEHQEWRQWRRRQRRRRQLERSRQRSGATLHALPQLPAAQAGQRRSGWAPRAAAWHVGRRRGLAPPCCAATPVPPWCLQRATTVWTGFQAAIGAAANPPGQGGLTGSGADAEKDRWVA